MRRFYVPVIGAVGAETVLGATESHHLLRVTGISPGESVELFDGQGGSFRGVLVGVVDGCARIEVLEALTSSTPIRPVWLFQAQLRANPMDTVIRMATEVGVERIVPIQTDRGVAKGDKRDRWMRVATAASAQCGRTQLPVVNEPISFAAALEMPPPGMARWMAIPGSSSAPHPAGAVAVLVGPEGGWTETECADALDAGWTGVGLSHGVLRADTASIVALTCALRSD